MLITLVRHGLTNANVENRTQGHIDTNLNPTGLLQAKKCGDALRDLSFDYVYCSDLARCKQTADAILYHHKQLDIEYVPSLREASLGFASGQTIKELTVKAREAKKKVRQLMVDFGGESEIALGNRIINAFNDIVNSARKKNYQSILIVTHGGPLRSLTKKWLLGKHEIAKASLNVFNTAHQNTAITRIKVSSDDTVAFLVFNSIAHLKPC
ncbi:histidine phosphatase superfamily [Sporodiniella umbellata]|nr:histidine phosphatase superfamily [Sporodiniella umbellata]